MRDEDNPIIKDVKRKIYEKGENCLVVFVGKVRSGKSLCGWQFCNLIVPSFSLAHCVFEIDNFYTLINNVDIRETAIMVEEMGLKSDKREFMQLQNRVISHTFQTFAHRSILLVMTVPSMAFIDSRIEHLIDYVFEATRSFKVGGKLKMTKFKARKYQHNPVIGKTYKKRPVFTVNGKSVKIKNLFLDVPDEATIAAYKEVSTKYKDGINVNIQQELKAKGLLAKEKTEGYAKDDDEIVAEILANPKKFLKKKGKVESVYSTTIGSFFPGVGGRRAARIAMTVNNKLEESK